jgi:L-asparaginase
LVAPTIYWMTSALISTGGTIGWSEKEQRMLDGDELARKANLSFDAIFDLLAIPSWDLTVTDMLVIAMSVRSAIDAGHQSVIVTHGTDTMEETAWLTDLLLGPDRRSRSRVIFTGAMRFSDAEDSDGADNIACANTQAIQTRRENQGVQIAFAGELHAARWVRKIDAFALDPFSSDSRPPTSGPLPLTTDSIEVNVAMVTSSAVVRQTFPDDALGVVLQGTGAAHVPSMYFDEIERFWARGRPVVIASRSRDVARTFNANDRVLWAGDLTAEKATLALMAALAVSTQLSEVCDWWSSLMSQSLR